MDRRKLLKDLAGFTGVASLVVKELLADERAAKVHLLGIGDGGCGMVGHFIDMGLDPSFTCINNEFGRDFLPNSKKVIYRVPENAYLRKGTRMVNLDTLASEQLKLQPAVEAVIADRERHYLIFSTFAGFTGTSLPMAISKKLRQRGVMFSMYIVLPMWIWSSSARPIALEMRERLEGFPNTFFFDQETLRQTYGNMKLKDVDGITNKEVYRIYQQKVCPWITDINNV